jgi:hypothetical protein
MEFKKRNVWSFKDIRTFVETMLRHTKNMEKVGEALPHKSAREIVFFYHTFKKLFNLKGKMRDAREFLKNPNFTNND